MKIPAFYFVAAALLAVTACIIEPRSRYQSGEHDHAEHEDHAADHQVWRE